jgi:hypothetical protein
VTQPEAAAGWLKDLEHRGLASESDGRYRYGLRLLAFLLILAAIVDKNRSAPPPPVPEHNGRPEPPVRKVEAR